MILTYVHMSVCKQILFIFFQDFSVYLSDGLHLSETGNQFVSEHVWSLLESKVAELPLILPYWADVDCKNPENSLLCD